MMASHGKRLPLLQVARTSTGLVNRARHSSTGCGEEQGAAAAPPEPGQAAQQQQPGGGDHAMAEAAPDQAAPPMDLPPASAELLCVTVDGQGRSTQDFMTLRLVHTASMAQVGRGDRLSVSRAQLRACQCRTKMHARSQAASMAVHSLCVIRPTHVPCMVKFNACFNAAS